MRSPANARKPLRTDGRTDRRTDGHAVKRLRLVGWTNGHMYRSKEAISGFGRTDGRTDGQTDRRTDGRTDGQPENIMPPAPKGGGIKKKKRKPSVAGIVIFQEKWANSMVADALAPRITSLSVAMSLTAALFNQD